MKILITAGGTTERIDKVRKITNTGTGRLGSMIAKEFVIQGGSKIEKIYYVCESHAVVPSLPCVEIITVEGVNNLMNILSGILSKEKIDAVVHSMAISDYTVRNLTTADDLASTIARRLISDYKQNFNCESSLSNAIAKYIKENDNVIDNSSKVGSNIENLLLSMEKTPKIIGLIKSLQPSTVLVGFKLLNNVEKETLLNTGYKLLIKNKCDFVLANDLCSIKGDNHSGLLISPDKSYVQLNSKDSIAKEIAGNVLKKIENKGDKI